MSKVKFSFFELALCNWFFSAPEGEIRFVTHSSSYHGSGSWHFHIGTKDAESNKWVARTIGIPTSQVSEAEAHDEYLNLKRGLGGYIKSGSYALFHAGILSSASWLSNGESLEKFKEKFSGMHLSNETLIRPYVKGREWWVSEGKAEYEAERTKRELSRNAVERRILIGAWVTMTPNVDKELTKTLDRSISLPLPSRKFFRPFATATVTKETAKRLTIDDIEFLPDFQKGQYSSYRFKVDWPISGRAPNEFIEPDSVMLEEPTEEVIEKLVAIHQDGEESFHRHANQSLSEIIPLLKQMHSRLDQQSYAVTDLVKEVIENFNNDNSNDRKP